MRESEPDGQPIKKESPEEPSSFEVKNKQVILVVGYLQVKIPVSAGATANASSVLDCLIQSAPEDPLTGVTKVKLASDDPNTMKILCHFIHGRTSSVPTEMSNADLLKLAILTDKYKCTDLTHLASSFWLRERCQSLPATWPEIVTLLHTAWLFNEPASFRTITKKIVLDTEWNLTNILQANSGCLSVEIYHKCMVEPFNARANMVSGS